MKKFILILLLCLMMGSFIGCSNFIREDLSEEELMDVVSQHREALNTLYRAEYENFDTHIPFIENLPYDFQDKTLIDSDYTSFTTYSQFELAYLTVPYGFINSIDMTLEENKVFENNQYFEFESVYGHAGNCKIDVLKDTLTIEFYEYEYYGENLPHVLETYKYVGSIKDTSLTYEFHYMHESARDNEDPERTYYIYHFDEGKSIKEEMLSENKYEYKYQDLENDELVKYIYNQTLYATANGPVQETLRIDNQDHHFEVELEDSEIDSVSYYLYQTSDVIYEDYSNDRYRIEYPLEYVSGYTHADGTYGVRYDLYHQETKITDGTIFGEGLMLFISFYEEDCYDASLMMVIDRDSLTESIFNLSGYGLTLSTITYQEFMQARTDFDTSFQALYDDTVDDLMLDSFELTKEDIIDSIEKDVFNQEQITLVKTVPEA